MLFDLTLIHLNYAQMPEMSN